VRKEVQGFVGRLARASEESPPVGNAKATTPEANGRELLLMRARPGAGVKPAPRPAAGGSSEWIVPCGQRENRGRLTVWTADYS
jgi:hypothetical protein